MRRKTGLGMIAMRIAAALLVVGALAYSASHPTRHCPFCKSSMTFKTEVLGDHGETGNVWMCEHCGDGVMLGRGEL